jgi:minor extracellular protease Epr
MTGTRQAIGCAAFVAATLGGASGGAALSTVGAILMPSCAWSAEREADTEREVERERDRERTQQDRESGADEEFDRDRETADRSRGDDAGRGESDRGIEPDEVLAIDLSAEGLAAARSMGFRVEEEKSLPDLGFRLAQLATPGGLPPPMAVRRLREADPRGTYDINPRYGAAAAPACEGIRCEGQKLIAWPPAGCLEAVSLGMVDTAVATSSPALTGSQIVQRHFGDSGGSAQGAEHGTQVATIFAGSLDAGFAGLVPKARLFAADVFNFGPKSGQSTNAVMIAQGLDWLLAQQPAVINVSVAGPDNAVLHETIRRVTARGVPVVAAAGNLGPDGPPQYPAAYPEAIAVTAVDDLGKIYARANRGDYIDVAAPGVHIWSAGADGRGRFVDGTSFAAPFVSAEVALLRVAEPQRTPSEVKAELRRRASASSLSSQQPGIGAGLLKSRGCPTASAAPAKVRDTPSDLSQRSGGPP